MPSTNGKRSASIASRSSRITGVAADGAVVHPQPAAVPEGVRVRLLDRRPGRGAHVREEERRLDAGGELAQVAVVPGRMRAAVDARQAVGGVPADAEAVAVRRRRALQRVQALVDERPRRLEQQLVEPERGARVREPAAHAPDRPRRPCAVEREPATAARLRSIARGDPSAPVLERLVPHPPVREGQPLARAARSAAWSAGGSASSSSGWRPTATRRAGGRTRRARRSRVLTTIVGATVGLTGFVVTVSVLVVQMATGTFSARYMRLWYRDAVLKAVLAVLIGTIVFSFALLRRVEDPENVPNLGVSRVRLLPRRSDRALPRLPRPRRPPAAAGGGGGARREGGPRVDAQRGRDRGVAATAGGRRRDPRRWPSGPPRSPRAARAPGAIQAIDEDGLVAWAREHDCVLVLPHAVGVFVSRGARARAGAR